MDISGVCRLRRWRRAETSRNSQGRLSLFARTRSHLPAIGLILLAALVLRVTWVIFVHPDPVAEGCFDDTAWYQAAAHYFANGDGDVNPFVGGPMTAAELLADAQSD